MSLPHEQKTGGFIQEIFVQQEKADAVMKPLFEAGCPTVSNAHLPAQQAVRHEGQRNHLQ